MVEFGLTALNADMIANSVCSDQTPALGLGSSLFVKTYLSLIIYFFGKFYLL